MSGQQLSWAEREPPLQIAGVLAQGEAAVALALRLAANLPDSLPNTSSNGVTRLRVHTGSNLIVVIGQPEDLGWVEGATWLGRDGEILCPAALVANHRTDLLATLIRRDSGCEGTVVVTTSVALAFESATSAPSRQQLTEFAANAGSAA